jgi:hypothetical protein
MPTPLESRPTISSPSETLFVSIHRPSLDYVPDHCAVSFVSSSSLLIAVILEFSGMAFIGLFTASLASALLSDGVFRVATSVPECVAGFDVR